MGTDNQSYFGPGRNWVNTGLLVSFRANNTVIDTCVVFISVHFTDNDELEAAA